MKLHKTLCFFIAFSLLLSLSVFADIAYEPFGDEFYSMHYDECEHHDHWYHINGAEGYVTVYSSPTGNPVVNIPNGREFRVGALWSKGSDGKTWACIEYFPDTLEHGWGDCESGWVDMSELVPRYGSREFMIEHEDELQHGLYQLDISEGMEVIAYRYPGSGIIVERFSYYKDWSNSLSLDYIYTDSEGRDWGHVNYYYATRSVWVCISDPCTELPAGTECREPELIPAASDRDMQAALGEVSGISTQLIVGAVGIVVIAIAIVAYIVIKKRIRIS